MDDLEKEIKNKNADETIEETAPSDQSPEKVSVDESLTEKVQFSDEQKEYMNQIIKASINKIKSDLENKDIELQNIKSELSLAVTNLINTQDEMAIYNDKLIENELISRGIVLSEKQLEMLKAFTGSFIFTNIEAIIDNVKTMIGVQTNFIEKDEVSKESNPKIENINDPLGLS